MKITNLLFTLTILFAFQINAQSVKGKIALNGKTEVELKFESNSAVSLFKDFKTKKYQLQFGFRADGVKMNKNKETIVFFDFITTITKDGEKVKKLIRSQPIPYFPGDMNLPAEAFDFVGILSELYNNRDKDMIGIMPNGKYTVQLSVKPHGVKGKIEPLEFSFVVR